MKSLPASKWISDLSPDENIENAAKKSLKLRLDAARALLSKSATSQKNEAETIHQSRVACRRAAATLELYADCLPARRSEWIAKRLKKLRKAAGPARDFDVLRERLAQLAQGVDGAPAVLQPIESESRTAHREFRKSHRRLRKDERLLRRLKSLPRRVGAPQNSADSSPDETRFADWSRTQLRRVVQEFFDAAPVLGSPAEELHQFRIECKRLRYTVELVGATFPSELREVGYPVLCTLQTKLGEINDLVTACAYVQKALDDPGEQFPLPPMRELLHLLNVTLSDAMVEFHSCWAEEWQPKLADCFEEMLADREETCEPLR